MTDKLQCKKCGAELADSLKFCGMCGASTQPPSDIKCPECGHENPPEFSFCGECGGPLHTTVKPPPTGRGAMTDKLACKKCGAEVALGHQFCSECGVVRAQRISEFGVARAQRITVTEEEKLPEVGFRQAIVSGYNKHVTYSGRARRSEYWYWMLFVVLVSLVAWIPVVGWLLGLSVILPTFALTARRLHDVGLSGWWQVIPFACQVYITVSEGWFYWGLVILALISSIALLVMMMRKGNLGPNRYGPDPRQPGSN